MTAPDTPASPPLPSSPLGQPIWGVVLAGGRGRRFGGADKGLQCLEGVPLARRVALALAPQVTALAINANRHGDIYGAWGYPVFGDQRPDYPGPLAGLLEALGRSPYPWVAAAPCDTPFLPPDLVARLAQALEENPGEIAAVRSGGREHPLCCLCPTSLAAPLAAYLDGGGQRVLSWLASRATRWVEFPDPDNFRNLNTPTELAAADRNQAR